MVLVPPGAETLCLSCFSGLTGIIIASIKAAHLVELPQILLLCLVDDSQDSGDRLADNTAATIKQLRLPSKTTNRMQRNDFRIVLSNEALHIPRSNVTIEYLKLVLHDYFYFLT